MAKTTTPKADRTHKTGVSDVQTTAKSGFVPTPAPDPANDSEKIERFAIPLHPETGVIILENMREGSRAKLLKAIRTTPNLNPSPSPALSPADEQAMNAVVANVLYDAISAVAIMTARSRGFSASSAQLLRYSDEEKSQFINPTIAVLNKYDLFKSQYKEEIVLLALVGTVTTAKIMAMQKAEALIVDVPSNAAVS